MTLARSQPSSPDGQDADTQPFSRSEAGFSRAAWLAGIIQRRVVCGSYLPGERIRENELQKEFGFSNGPVREALQIVVNAGLAERAPWQGVHVIDLGEREILELFQLRAALIQYVVELAARHGSDEILAQAGALKDGLREVLQSCSDIGWALSFSGRLSAWLLAAAGNATISRLWDNTLLRAQIYVNASMRHGADLDTAAIIYTLIDAVAARDAPKALEEAHRLARRTLANLGIDGPI